MAHQHAAQYGIDSQGDLLSFALGGFEDANDATTAARSTTCPRSVPRLTIGGEWATVIHSRTSKTT